MRAKSPAWSLRRAPPARCRDTLIWHTIIHRTKRRVFTGGPAPKGSGMHHDPPGRSAAGPGGGGWIGAAVVFTILLSFVANTVPSGSPIPLLLLGVAIGLFLGALAGGVATWLYWARRREQSAQASSKEQQTDRAGDAL
jgi:hypothetical protein